MDDDGFTSVRHTSRYVSRAGSLHPYWKVTSGLGTVKESQGGWTQVTTIVVVRSCSTPSSPFTSSTAMSVQQLRRQTAVGHRSR